MNNLEKLRKDSPLIVCYTNDVVKNFTANGLLSLGASPAMSEAPEEADDFFNVASALLINIGTLTERSGQDMLAIAKIANQKKVPIVFDPVAVGASQYRKDFCKKFLQEVDVAVIKGNASEIQVLTDDNVTMKGTDSADNLDVVAIAKQAHETFKTAIVLSGAVDVIAQDNQIYKISNGTDMLTKITGAGCLLGAVVASYLNKSLDPNIDALIESVATYNIAGEKATLVENGDLPGHFLVNFIDALNEMSYEEYKMNRKIEEVK